MQLDLLTGCDRTTSHAAESVSPPAPALPRRTATVTLSRSSDRANMASFILFIFCIASLTVLSLFSMVHKLIPGKKS